MNITKEQLKKIIKEELAGILSELEGSVSTPQIKASPGRAALYISGLGTATERGGAPIYVEYNEEGVWELLVWSDISSEDPTHRINLSAATETEGL